MLEKMWIVFYGSLLIIGFLSLAGLMESLNANRIDVTTWVLCSIVALVMTILGFIGIKRNEWRYAE